jgi:magnesium transporter
MSRYHGFGESTMRNVVADRSGKRGQAPGTPKFVGKKYLETPRISIITYSESQATENLQADIAECLPSHGAPHVTWVNIDGLHDEDLIASVAHSYGLHPLVLEDILNTTQRPRCEDYGDFLYITLKMLRWDPEQEKIDTEQVSLILGEGYVLSFQEKPGDVFASLRDRIAKGKGRIRTMGADYLAYSLIDAIIDEYFAILEEAGEVIEDIEGDLAVQADSQLLQRIHRLKREGLLLRRSAWPARDMLNTLEQVGGTLLTDEVRLYLRDVYGHSVQVIDTIETLRDLLAGMLDTYLSSVNNRMNEVMKVLTFIATIFIPLSFIAGLYGMNFRHIPELEWRWGYAAVLVLMAMVASGMLFYFKKKKWF